MTDAGVISNPEWQGRRITDMIYESLLWTYGRVLKLGYNNWKTITPLGGVAGSTLEGISCAKVVEVEMPTDINYEIPIDYLAHGDWTRVARRVELMNWEFVNNNTVLAPSVNAPIFCQVGKEVYIKPATLTAPSCLYTRLPVAPVYDNNSTALDISDQYLEAVIDRVVMQIKAQLGDLQTKQLSLAEIDKFIMEKYQLVTVKPNQRKVTE